MNYHGGNTYEEGENNESIRKKFVIAINFVIVSRHVNTEYIEFSQCRCQHTFCNATASKFFMYDAKVSDADLAGGILQDLGYGNDRT